MIKFNSMKNLFNNKVNYLEYDKDFLAIKKLLKESFYINLNLFDMIGIGRQEIRHSYFLRWLCGENEHYFRHIIFIDFLKSVYPELKGKLNKKDISFNIPLNEYTFKYKNKTRHLDFIAIDNENKRIFVIEVKIDASEHGDQLTAYYEHFNQKDIYFDYEKRFIYLTVDGSKPKDEINNQRWKSVNYNRILKSIESIIESRSIDVKLKYVLEDYIELLKKHKNMAKNKNELQEISENIWNDHRDVIEVILHNIPSRNGGLIQLLKDHNYNDVELTVYYNKQDYKIILKKDGLLWYKDKSYENTKQLYKGLFFEKEGRKNNSGTSETYDTVNWLKLNGIALGKKYLDAESNYKKYLKEIKNLNEKYLIND